MLNAHCLVCSDKNSFRGKVFSLENVQRRVLELISLYERKLNSRNIEVPRDISREVLHGVSNEHNHHHMMCGHCPQVDSNKIKRIDDKIHQGLAVICTILNNEELDENDKNNLYHASLQIFRGHYPMSYRFLERYYHTKVNK